METEEIWRDIEGYPRYRVSNKGNVWSEKQNKLLKVSVNNSGYAITTLSNKGKARSFRTHRLVAQAFTPNPDDLPEINHIDEVKLNNCVENLEWCTREYNNNYRTPNSKPRTNNGGGRKKKPVIGTSVTTGEKIYFEGATTAALAGFTCIRPVLGKYNNKGRRKKRYGYIWDYATDGEAIESYFREVTTTGIYWGTLAEVAKGKTIEISLGDSITYVYLNNVYSVQEHKQDTIEFCLVNVSGVEVPKIYKDKPLAWGNQ